MDLVADLALATPGSIENTVPLQRTVVIGTAGAMRPADSFYCKEQ
jgi:hypothetical protein